MQTHFIECQQFNFTLNLAIYKSNAAYMAQNLRSYGISLFLIANTQCCFVFNHTSCNIRACL